ncbi:MULTISPECIES: LLM class flavin-dependent oxidoreductase [Xenorhabdus]|uniref:LLM class flavin-dependent oxidoreductase n=1 Tax=Xenorhabdus TaxID=626 RepID=UPI001FC9D635|nr:MULTISPECIES: LLM class flavin-dependent oxidoreductase [Xenorhabdus]
MISLCPWENGAGLAGIAEVTHRAKLIATVHAGLHNPAVTTKMIATLDHISQGRARLNIVSGSFRDEFEQISFVPANPNKGYVSVCVN